jgi:RHS repeat-associated protein
LTRQPSPRGTTRYTSGNITDEFVFLGSKRIAHRYASGEITYYAEDMLGTNRVILPSAAGSPCYDADFYPFGGEREYTTNCAENYKFEGKKRDQETGNDDFGARYYSSSFGRWESPDWSSIPVPVPYANLTNPQTLNLYMMASDDPETFADLDGQLGGVGEPVVEPVVDPVGGDSQESKGHEGAFARVWDWLDVIEVSGSYGVGASISGQAGAVEARAQAGTEVEGTVGLGGGNKEVTAFGGAKASTKVGPAEGEVKAGLTVSSKDGVSLNGEARGSVGGVGGSVKVDKSGVHVESGGDKSKDVKLGGHAHLGLGVGVNINFSQAGRAYDNTMKSFQALVQYLSSTYMPKGLP